MYDPFWCITLSQSLQNLRVTPTEMHPVRQIPRSWMCNTLGCTHTHVMSLKDPIGTEDFREGCLKETLHKMSVHRGVAVMERWSGGCVQNRPLGGNLSNILWSSLTISHFSHNVHEHTILHLKKTSHKTINKSVFWNDADKLWLTPLLGPTCCSAIPRKFCSGVFPPGHRHTAVIGYTRKINYIVTHTNVKTLTVPWNNP